MIGKRKVFWVLLILIVVGLDSCKKKNTVDPSDQRKKELVSVWSLGSVENDDADVTSQFTGFELTVDSDLNYTTVNGGNAWPGTGSFILNENDIDVLTRSDGVEVSIDEISSSALELSFQINSLPGGRANGITGNFTFSLQKQ